jgi:hypothetical protein
MLAVLMRMRVGAEVAAAVLALRVPVEMLVVMAETVQFPLSLVRLLPMLAVAAAGVTMVVHSPVDLVVLVAVARPILPAVLILAAVVVAVRSVVTVALLVVPVLSYLNTSLLHQKPPMYLLLQVTGFAHQVLTQ